MKLKKINPFANWSDKRLKSEYTSIFNSIKNLDCFSTCDLTQERLLANELERRGYEIQEQSVVSFVKVK